jgi:hypothetical protein
LGEPDHVPLTNKIKLHKYQSILKAFQTPIYLPTPTLLLFHSPGNQTPTPTNLFFNEQESRVKSDNNTTPLHHYTTTPSYQQNSSTINNCLPITTTPLPLLTILQKPSLPLLISHLRTPLHHQRLFFAWWYFLKPLQALSPLQFHFPRTRI